MRNATGGNCTTTAGEEGRVSYLDLLAAVLAQHEKNLCRLIERLEVLYETLTTLNQQMSTQGDGGPERTEEDQSKVLRDTYLKIAKYIQ